jgi:hypothetical protein
MDCREARDLLLRSDGPIDGPLADHVAGCDSCARLAGDLALLEETWREIPLPVDYGRGRERFLAKLPILEAPRSAGLSKDQRRVRRWLVAASVLVALGLWGGVLATGRRASASSDVVERLVDWNLNLARVESPDERGRLYADHAPVMAVAVERATLPAGDRELAYILLGNAPWLVGNADPLAEADRFNDLADQILHRMSAATRGGDDPRVERYARLYNRVVELGIASKFDVIEKSASLDFDGKRRLERLVLRDADRMKALVALLEKAPDSSRKEIKKALGITRRPKVGAAADPETPRKAKGKGKKPKSDEPSPE